MMDFSKGEKAWNIRDSHLNLLIVLIDDLQIRETQYHQTGYSLVQVMFVEGDVHACDQLD
jgi:hypothetical protein